jgi:serine/threonine protein kinase/sugar lactone lactonase YvrE
MASPDLFCNQCGAANTAMATTCFACGNSLAQDDPLLILTGTVTSTAPVSSSPAITGQLAHDHLLNGRYRIVRQLGTGGFGAVYEAQDLQRNGALVAIKSINLHGLSSEEAIDATETFNREVGMLSELEHPNLPHIYEHFSDSEHWYLVMDFIIGETLDESVSKLRRGHLAVETVVEIGIQLCEVLSYLHSQQPPIIFRDVKPANVMRSVTGHLYLIDFGIARRFRPGQKHDTSVLGSPGYAPPEQYGRAQTTVQSDIYSLGATLRFLLTGQEPVGAFPVPESSYIQEVPLALQHLLAQMLAMEVDKRPSSIAIVKQRLLQIKGELEQKAVPYTASARSSPSPHTPTSASSGSPPAGKQKMLFWSSLSSAPYKLWLAIFLIIFTILGFSFHFLPGEGSDTQFPSNSLGNANQFADCAPDAGAREITAGPDRALWFTESCSDKIGRITTQGSITQFTLPTDTGDIAAGPDGAIWFENTGIDKIGRITPQGTITLFALPTTYSGVYGITAGPDGAIWFIGGQDKIVRITTQGTTTEFNISTKDSVITGITAGPDGALWFTEGAGNKIGRISPKGKISEFALPTRDSSPDQITTGPDGALWFTADAGKIGRITTQGRISEFPFPTNDIRDITAGPDGAIWFCELESNKIGRITPKGSITQFALPLSASGPLWITAGPDGALWFVEYGKIGRITTKGSITEFPAPS